MLATTQNVAAAARSVGMGRQSAYKLRARLDDQPFGAAWRLALRNARNTVLDAAIERAVNGVEVPHFYKGELIGTSRRYDERLTTALLAGGALQRSTVQLCGAEREFAERGLPRLLDRIANGPTEWCDLEDERDFAWGLGGIDEGDCEPDGEGEDWADACDVGA
jgi:hypothetical protein